MSSHVLPDFTCAECGKRGWFSKRNARKVLRQMRDRHGNAGVLRAYPACTGSGFHIGHDEPHRPGGRPNLNDPRLRFLPGT
ncbi:hypothetical protein [Pseudonocardia zijingensis]|uniref:HNH endonuclease n=1 Tax=Pseudonocardia zijingensis TaxID=153376 RepID=A0ABN1N8Y7_9PSEU